MKKIRTSKRMLLILLLCLPITLLLSAMMPSVAGKEYVPIMHPNNQWYWHDEIFPGELLIFEEESVVFNYTTGELITQYRMLSIYNITGFVNVTLDESKYPDWGETSVVLGKQLYYNCSSEVLLTYNTTELYGDAGFGDDLPLAMFGYNDTRVGNEEHYMGLHGSIAPAIIPINDTGGVEVDKMAEIINSTYFTAYSQSGGMNAFDTYSSNIPLMEMYFSSNDGYFMDMSFYDNGTIKDLACSILMQMGPGPADKIIVNATINRVFRYDYLLDGVEWSFSEGDTFYFGDNNKWYDGGSGSDPEYHYDELEIKIVEIGNETVGVSGSYGNWYYQCFSYVLANLSFWNDQTKVYESMMDDPILMGMANSLCPANMMAIMGGEMKYFEDRNIQVVSTPTIDTIVVGSNPNNQSWQGAEISRLTGYDGMETGDRYEIINVYLDTPSPGDITIQVDRTHTFGIGDYFDIRPMPFERPHFVFYPINTDPEDVAFVMYPAINYMMEYDNFYAFPDGTFVMNHSTYNDEMRGKYNIATGIFEWSWSKDDMGELRSIQFRKNHTTLYIATESMLYPQELIFPELGSTQFYAVHSWGSEIEAYSAALPFNPVFKPLFAELPSMPLYLDFYTSESYTGFNISLRIVYDDSLLGGFDETELTPYAYNMFTDQWQASPDYAFTINPILNEIVINIPNNLLNVTYYAIGAGEEWNWGVGLGDSMTYLCQGEVYGSDGPKPYNDFSTFNITSITPNIMHYSEPYSQINTSSMYYHPSIMSLVPTGQVQTMGEFGIRPGDGLLQMWLDRWSWGIPAIVPLRYGSLDLWEVGRALRDFFVAEGPSMGFPTFDGWIVSGNNLHMSIAGGYYYLDLTYYNNGILEEWDVYSTVFEQGFLTEFRLEGNHESDVNPINDISWGVNPGDTFYFGSPPMGKMMVEITTVGDNAIRGMGMEDLRLSIMNSSLAFSHVLANIYMWNDLSLTWDLENSSYPIAAANDYFSFTMNNPNLLLVPYGVTGLDVYESFSPFMNVLGFDTLIEVGNDYLRLGGSATATSGSTTSSESPFLDWYFDSNTGVTELFVGRAKVGPGPEDLEMFGLYQMTYNDILVPSTQIFDFSNPLIPGFKATANITTIGYVEMLYALISDMPTSATIGNGTILFFSDILVPNPANITSMLFTFELPSSYNLLAEYDSYHFWIWDESLTHPDFRELSAAEIAGAIVGRTTTTLKVNFTALDLEGSINIIFAITKSLPDELMIPGYDIILLLGVISLGSVVIYLKKRRNIKL